MPLSPAEKKFFEAKAKEGLTKEEAIAAFKKAKLQIKSPTVAAVLPTIKRAEEQVGQQMQAEQAIQDQASVAGRSTGIERPEGAVKEGVKMEEIPEEEKGIVDRFKEGAGKGVQSAYQTEQLVESGAQQLKEEKGLDVPEGSMIPGGLDLQSIINTALPVVRGVGEVLAPAFEKTMEAPIPTSMGSYTLNDAVKAGGEAIPEEAKQEIAAKVDAMTQWYESQPDYVKGALKQGGALGEIALGFFGGLEAKNITKQTVKTLAPELSNFKTGIANKIESTTGKVKQVLDTKAVDMMNSNIKIDPKKGAVKFYELSDGQTHGEFLIERGFIGSPEQVAEDLAKHFNAVKQRLNEGIASIKGAYKPASVKDVLDELIPRFQQTKDPLLSRMKALQTKFNKEGLTTSEILELKRIFERKVPMNFSKGDNSISVDRANNIDNMIRKDLQNIAAESGFENFPEMSKEIQLTKHLFNSVESKNIKKTINNQFSLTDNMLMIAGAVEPSSLAVLGLKKIGGTPSIQAKIINALASGDIKAIKGIPAVPDEVIQIKNAEKRAQALADWLDEGGFTAIENETGMKLLQAPESIQLPGASDPLEVRSKQFQEKTGVFSPNEQDQI